MFGRASEFNTQIKNTTFKKEKVNGRRQRNDDNTNTRDNKNAFSGDDSDAIYSDASANNEFEGKYDKYANT